MTAGVRDVCSPRTSLGAKYRPLSLEICCLVIAISTVLFSLKLIR
jgi:hypothetical protein